MSSRIIFLIYAALSIVYTYPLILGLGSDVPGDLGDSLLNMWILGWGVQHIPLLLTGQIGWADFWNANIFHPDPLALALSEHLFGLSMQVMPVFWLTGNIILCYNLLFISTFALSAFGAYLLVRDLTGDRRAAFVAGLVYGFLPYRIASVPHLQVMSSQWMPFALWGLNRFVTSPRGDRPGIRPRTALVLGAAALVMQNWSCGYYLLYFAPFVPLFVLHRMWTTTTLKDPRIWVGLTAAAVGVIALTAPFLAPYAEAQQRFGFERTFGEIVLFSANVWSYITASENVRLYGQVLRYYPHGEGETFLGFVPWLLTIAALAGLILHRSTRTASFAANTPSWRSYVAAFLLLVVVAQLIAVISVFLFGGFEFRLLGLTVSARTPQRLVMQLVIAIMLLLGLSPRARHDAMRMLRSPIFFAIAATTTAVWLSLGPIPKAGDSLVSGLGLYNLLYDHVPGFNGVRAPARYAMIAGLFLAVAAGFGALRLLSLLSGRRMQLAVVALISSAIVAEGAAIPFELNRTWNQNEAMPPSRVFPYAQSPPVYSRIAALPGGTAISEFPYGDAAWEIRYVYYAAAHRKPITNGYSGNFPPAYKERVARLMRVHKDPDAAWRSLIEAGTTHVIVHRNAFANAADADTVERWLKAHGATELERFPDNDILLSVN